MERFYNYKQCKNGILIAMWVVIGLIVAFPGVQIHAKENSIAAVIQRAGNTESDEVRLNLLKQLRERPNLDNSFKEDLTKLITQIERWLGEQRLDYFGRYVSRNKDFHFQIPENSPLYPLTWLYRGRMVIWYTIESGGVWSIPQRRREFFGIARGFFDKAARAFPENKITRMYLGQPTGPYKKYQAITGAPKWAIYQREGLERLTDIIEWWIDN
ncbi:MAG: hypothetical protein ACYS17_08390, partial [Planctomycetota bacterium]